MLLSYVRGQTGIILRIKIQNSAASNNLGAVGITNTTPGLVIANICDNEASAASYSSASSTIDSITTLGTYAAPTSGHCRFRQVDPTLLPGVYELQFVNGRFAISGAKSLLITISAINAYNVAQTDILIGLLDDDPYLSKPNHFSVMDIDASGHLNLQPTGLDLIVKDSYTATQAIFVGAAMLVGEMSGLPSSPVSVKGMDGATTRAVISFDSNSNRLSSVITPP